MKTSTATKQWTRNEADRLAAADYEFDQLRGMYMVWWIERHCVLWEGNYAGQRLILNSYYPDEPDWWHDLDRKVHELPDHQVALATKAKAKTKTKLPPPPPYRVVRNDHGFLERFPWFQLRKPKRGDYSKTDAGKQQFDRDTGTHKQTVAWTKARCKWHLDRIKKGQHVDWPFEAFMRAFGWVTKRPGDSGPQRGLICRRFKRAHIWVGKKNKKSPSQAALQIGITAGDGEPGNHTFPMASSGIQIRKNVGRHVHKMISKSPDLKINFRLIDATKEAEHLPSDGKIEPLASNNESAQQDTEGKNGNVSVDEFHVVDRKQVDRVDQAGASRPEPLFSTFSTAGDEPDSIGKETWDEGITNNATGEDLRRLDISYHAPQRLKIAQVLADPEKYIRMANPALGHTTSLEDIVDLVHDAKGSPRNVSKLFRYRFNIWLRSSNVFIEPADWDACGRKYGLEKLRGLGGAAGLDVSQVDDLSSVVLAIEPNDELAKQFKIPKRKATKKKKPKDNSERKPTYYFDDEDDLRDVRRAILWPITWITESKLEWFETEAKKDFRPWVDAGHLRVIEGVAMDAEDIAEQIIEVFEYVGVTDCSADPHLARALAKSIQRQSMVEFHEFKQDYPSYTHPTKQFENFVLSRQLVHPNNPMFSWQLHNTLVKDMGARCKPVKFDRHSWKKIDAVQAGIMALDALARTDGISGGTTVKHGAIGI